MRYTKQGLLLKLDTFAFLIGIHIGKWQDTDFSEARKIFKNLING